MLRKNCSIDLQQQFWNNRQTNAAKIMFPASRVRSALQTRSALLIRAALKKPLTTTLKRSVLLLLLTVISLFGLSYALDSQTETAQDARHLGVASCSSSTCHGSTIPFAESNVLQNEFRIWNENDPHARAYQTLLKPESVEIARKLGLESAHTANICLGCHSDNVAPELRGEEFQISEGIGCEACHGGAQNYLDTHTRNTHAQNLAQGLTRTENPTDRALLCASCHVGNHTDRKITHTIMGAGHPRLSFELNTFSSIQPAHYQVDDDYIGRKGEHNELQIWAVGQLVAAEQLLTNVGAFPRSGLFPELAHMDCLGCHQPMSKINWAANPLTKTSPGDLRYNDAHLLMSYQLSKAIAPDLAEELLINTQKFLNNGVAEKTVKPLTAKLIQNLNAVRSRLEQSPLSAEQGQTIIQALIKTGLTSSHQGYASAEQSAMAINSVIRVLSQSNARADKKAQLLAGLEKMFKAVDDAESYQAKTFVTSLRELQSAL